MNRLLWRTVASIGFFGAMACQSHAQLVPLERVEGLRANPAISIAPAVSPNVSFSGFQFEEQLKIIDALRVISS